MLDSLKSRKVIKIVQWPKVWLHLVYMLILGENKYTDSNFVGEGPPTSFIKVAWHLTIYFWKEICSICPDTLKSQV